MIPMNPRRTCWLWLICALVPGVTSILHAEEIACAPAGSLQADFDIDGDIDTGDWRPFPACMGGPDSEPDPAFPVTLLHCVEAFNFDGDRDIDLVDAAELMRRFTGPCSGSVACPDGEVLVHESGATNDPDDLDGVIPR